MAYAVIRKTAGHWEVKTRRAHTFTPTSAVKEDKVGSNFSTQPS